mmetsp:Transcript_271/g.676  ORF Transcript_271/g.676 Transcript_271/m.676 type:complete len:303 (-) Transcript_271:173-1081(-)
MNIKAISIVPNENTQTGENRAEEDKLGASTESIGLCLKLKATKLLVLVTLSFSMTQTGRFLTRYTTVFTRNFCGCGCGKFANKIEIETKVRFVVGNCLQNSITSVIHFRSDPGTKFNLIRTIGNGIVFWEKYSLVFSQVKRIRIDGEHGLSHAAIWGSWIGCHTVFWRWFINGRVVVIWLDTGGNCRTSQSRNQVSILASLPFGYPCPDFHRQHLVDVLESILTRLEVYLSHKWCNFMYFGGRMGRTVTSYRDYLEHSQGVDRRRCRNSWDVVVLRPGRGRTFLFPLPIHRDIPEGIWKIII